MHEWGDTSLHPPCALISVTYSGSVPAHFLSNEHIDLLSKNEPLPNTNCTLPLASYLPPPNRRLFHCSSFFGQLNLPFFCETKVKVGVTLEVFKVQLNPLNTSSFIKWRHSNKHFELKLPSVKRLSAYSRHRLI